MNKGKLLAVLTLGLALAVTDPGQAQNAPSPQDVIRDAVEPYIPGRERVRFLRAGGVDNDLDEAETKANAQAPDPFIRKFDNWAALKAFDRDSNNKLDWFEADAYRRGLRAAVIAQYDKNANKRLDADELTAAATDLAAGKAPKITAPATPSAAPVGAPSAPPRPGENRRAEFIQRFDTNGDGQLDENERRAARRVGAQQFRQDLLNRFDTDKDGKISDAERQAMPPQQRLGSRFMDLAVQHFDDNGDGQISDAEEQAMEAFGRQAQQIGQQLDVKFNDNDGDGQVTPAERQANQQKAMAIGLQLMPKLQKLADTNGDGQVDQTERQAGFQRLSGIAEEQIGKWTQKFDADGNGRLSASERTALLDGVRADVDQRYKTADANSDGKLDVAESTRLIETFMSDLGLDVR